MICAMHWETDDWLLFVNIKNIITTINSMEAAGIFEERLKITERNVYYQERNIH
jgi:hypothetical protein